VKLVGLHDASALESPNSAPDVFDLGRSMLWILAALENPSTPIPIPPQHTQSRSGGAGGDGGIAQVGEGAAAVASTLPTAFESSHSELSSPSNFKENDCVQALWAEDGKWYPAHVLEVKPGGVYSINFDGWVEEYDFRAHQMRPPAFDERAELEKVRSYDPSLMLLLQWMTEPVQLDPSNPSNRADMMDVLRHP
jgi:hypothetical protein